MSTNPAKMAAIFLLVMMVLMPQVGAQTAKSSYAMDRSEDCNFIGFLDMPTDKVVTIQGVSQGSSSNIFKCKLQFRAADDRDSIELSFSSYLINDCDVVLFISMGESTSSSSYGCDTPRPGSMVSTTGRATIQLDRRNLNDIDYHFTLTLRAYKPGTVYNPTDSNPQTVGLIAGIIAGVIGFFILLAVLVICCYRRKKSNEKRRSGNEFKKKLDEESNTTYGYDNDVRNGGPEYGGDTTPGSNKKLLMSDKEYNGVSGYRDNDDNEDKDKKYRMGNNEADSSNSSGERKAPLMESYSTSPKKSTSFDFDSVKLREVKKDTVQQEPTTPTSPMLSALHKNPKFRASFAANEAEAEERAKRISSYSSGPDSLNDSIEEPVRSGKKSIPPPPPLPHVPKSPGTKRSTFASIRRAPRPSSSSEEIQQIERGEYDDRDIRVIRRQEDPPSPSEIVPIKVSDPHQSKPKFDTQHTLRPNRGKSPKGAKKNLDKHAMESTSEPGDQATRQHGDGDKGTRPAGGFQKNTGLRKSSRKSPRVGRGSRPSVGSLLDDNESIGGRDTPTSQVSRYTRDDDDDLDSNYQPLRRTGSRQSLYASRSSLYGRRGRRERHGSFGESSVMTSYSRDDIDAYSHDDFDKRKVSRRESMRKNFRSLGDLEYESREISTQTLRETASQTGIGKVTPRKGASKKAAARKHSTSSTASTRKPRSRKSSMKDEDDRSEDEEPTRKPSTAKTAKTAKSAATAKSATEKPKPKPKPKPAPRKSTTSAKHQEELDSTVAEQVPVLSTPSAMPYPGQMVPGGPMVYPQAVPGQPYAIGPGGVPMMQPYPRPMMAPGQTGPQVVFAPVARMPAGVVPGPPRPPGPGASSGKPPGKSSWDILCAITDQEKNSDNTETSSVTGSVFSHHGHRQPDPYSTLQYPPPSGSQPDPYSTLQYPPPGVQYPSQGAQYPQQGAQYPQQGVQYPQQGVQYPQQGVQYPQQVKQPPPPGVQYQQPGYAPPPGSVSFVGSPYIPSVSGGLSELGSGQYPTTDYGSGVGSGYPASTASSHHSSDHSGSALPSVKLPSTDKTFPRQASWEVLNEMAKAEKQETGSHKTESIV